MNLVFMGSPEFAVPSLRALAASRHRVLEVVTQPDRPRGRGRRLAASPVGALAHELGLPVLKPERFADPDVVAHLDASGADVFAVVAYGELLRKRHLAIPPRGCVNVHPSLLPRHRGAVPIQSALLAGDDVTGVTTMFMARGLDTGDMLLQRATEVRPGENAGSLHDRLSEMGAELLVETLDGLSEDALTPIPQDDARATLCHKLTKADGRIDWTRDALDLYRHVRAMTPWPGAVTGRGGSPLTVLAADLVDVIRHDGEPGRVVGVAPGRGPVLATGRGRLCVTSLKPAGSRAMDGASFVRGHRVEVGERWHDDGTAAR